ncbi:WD40/YVTN/BNR-like repeat-containing protein [Mucisphaera calidilacus]|uniref:Xyloglucanase n=1 Tax=Mucisphaera calidilacus TaxID=2527982 RepID=A0A518BU36_9BACT|nr:hypothetical protein [Mucisphaera calidilacus]QDU70489.1 Xyloglucanase precursor [Mucisphaera calidilacus]
MRHPLTMYTVLFVCLCLNLMASSGSAAGDAHRPEHRRYGDWTSCRIGGGGYILGVRYTPDPDRLYAWTDVGGAYRSDDAGRTWRHITWTLPYGGSTESRGMMYVRDLLPDHRDPDRVAIVIGYHWSPPYGVMISDDAGRSWRAVLEEVWVCGDDETRMDGSVLVRDARRPETIWCAGIRDGVFVSRDNGETWASLGGPETQPTDLLVDRSDSGRLWLSGLAMHRGVIERYANTPDGQLKLPGGLWRTADHGGSWERLVGGRDVRGLVQDPVVSSTLYAIFDDHRWIMRSEDAGERWHRYDTGLDIGSPSPWGPHPHRYQALTVAHGVVYATSTRGQHYRLDRARDRWVRLSGPENVREPEGWWGATLDDPTHGTDSWVSTMASVARLTVSPHNPSDRWMTDWYSAYHSGDGGRTWTNRSEGFEVTYIDALEQDPTDPSIVHLGMADNGYFRSDDAGLSFRGFSNDTPITNNIKSLSVPKANPRRVYAVGPNPPGGGWYAGHVFISNDRGSTWRSSSMDGLPEITEAGHRAHTILALDDAPDTVFLTVTQSVVEGGGGLYRSLDGGESWVWFGEGLPGGVAFYRHESWRGGKELAVSPDGVMLTQSIQNRLLYRRRPGDGGWVRLDFPFHGDLNDLRADPHRAGRFYAAVLQDGVYRTDDAGSSWLRLTTPTRAPGASQLVVDRVVPGRLAAGTANGVILSRDSGRSWVHLDPSLPGRIDWNKGAFVGDRLVVGSGGHGAFWIDLRRR